jgi:prepilin peptidase CpaA
LSTLANVHDGPAPQERPRGFSAAAGLLLTAPVLASGWAASMPLPILGWAAAFLFLAVEHDVRCHRIPNWLTFPSFAAALAYAALIGGSAGVLDALLGAGAALALLLVPYAVGALGAGDVKAAMALGAAFGLDAVGRQLLLAIAFGGAIAALRVTLAGEWTSLARRWGHMLAASLLARRPVYLGPPADSAVVGGVPFAVAIALAVSAQQLLEVAR